MIQMRSDKTDVSCLTKSFKTVVSPVLHYLVCGWLLILHSLCEFSANDVLEGEFLNIGGKILTYKLVANGIVLKNGLKKKNIKKKF